LLGLVDVVLDEGPLVGAAEQEQRLGEVDRSGVDGVEAVDEFVVVAVRIVASHVEEGLRDRQRGAQLVGGVGCESLLFGDVCLEPREEAVDGVGEILQLVTGPGEREALVQVALGDLPCGHRHRPQRAQDPARDQPTERDRRDGHEPQYDHGPEEPLVECVGGTADELGVLQLGGGVLAGRPMRRPVLDDQVDPGGAAEDQVGDREQHHPRDEEETAVEAGASSGRGFYPPCPSSGPVPG
jgi:hypothetical protein